MITCWVIYTYKNQLSGNMAKKFTSDSYEEIEVEMKSWYEKQTNLNLIDVVESVYKDEDEDL